MHVLFCHGLESGPNGYKSRALRSQGALVTAPDMQMSLFNPAKTNSLVRSLLSPSALFTRWPSQWLAGALGDSFEACLEVQRAALQSDNSFDVLIGSSWGGAVAAALVAEGSWKGPAVLLCPALGELRRRTTTLSIVERLAELPTERKAQCLLVHGDMDETVPLADSSKLSEETGIALVVIEGGNHGMGAVASDGRLFEFAKRVLGGGGAVDVPGAPR